MRYYLLLSFLAFPFFLTSVCAQSLPSIAPTASYTNSDGTTQTETVISESAPLTVSFSSGAENTTGWNTHYEW
ncbi:MAG: gliding motility-associated C-terminal domain-containing protein, partial [Prevotellaceae bacterium]|nr:gliding motility-associated C-terminal domain-containing protein [Prevotellaceae bacterium]